MRKLSILILIGILAITNLTGCAKVLPKTIAQSITSEVKEVQFTTSGLDIYRLNIYVGNGQTINGSFKSDNGTSSWYTTPGAVTYPLGETGNWQETYSSYEVPVSGAPYFIQKTTNEKVYFGGSYGMNFKIDSSVGGSGYYTLCFKPYFTTSPNTINVTLRYWLE
jgi:hypothetical protein